MSRLPLTVFISHCDADAEWKHRLVMQLAPLQRAGHVRVASISSIPAGQTVAEYIEREIGRAGIAVLLVSPAFVASDSLFESQLTPILKRQQKDGLHVLPVLTGAVDIEAIEWLASRQCLPRDGRHLRLHDETHAETALRDIAAEIRTLVEQTPAPRLVAPPPAALSRGADATPRARESLSARRPQVMVDLTLEDGLLVRRHTISDEPGRWLPGERLDQLARSVGGERLRLSDLLSAIAAKVPPSIEGARFCAMGEILFDTLFGHDEAAWRPVLTNVYKQPGMNPTYRGVRVRVVSQDQRLAALPWMSVHWKGAALIEHQWTFEVGGDPASDVDVALSAPGRLLLIAPSPDTEGLAQSEATDAHVAALRELIDTIRPGWAESPLQFRVARTMTDAARAAQEMRPEIVAVLARAEKVRGRLCFDIADRAGTRTLFLHEMLAGLPALVADPPRALLISACVADDDRGPGADSLTDLRAPLVMLHHAPAPLVRAFAMTWLSRVLRDREDPILTACDVARAWPPKLDDFASLKMSGAYQAWITQGPPEAKAEEIEPWLKLDRDDQRGKFHKHLGDLLEHPSKRLEAVLAYGGPNTHVEEVATQLHDYVHGREGDRIHIRVVRVPLPGGTGPLPPGSIDRELLRQPEVRSLRPWPPRTGDVLGALAPEPLDRPRVLWLEFGTIVADGKRHRRATRYDVARVARFPSAERRTRGARGRSGRRVHCGGGARRRVLEAGVPPR